MKCRSNVLATVLAALTVLLAACSPNIPRVVSPTPLATPQVRARPTDGRVPTAGVAGQRFRIGQRATSADHVLAKIVLELRTAQIAANTLQLRVAFVNTSDERFRLVGTISGRDARLLDASGTAYAPLAVEPTLKTLDPAAGFAPGTANVGTLSFPIPDGNQPLQLQFPSYQPITFTLDTPQPASAAVANGQYPLDVVIRSQADALRLIELRFKSVEISADAVSFDLGFANVGRQGYNLVVGPDGGSARLVDGEGQEIAPSSVSPLLANSIAPKDGWQPQQEQRGTISFPRPRDLSHLRFVFPEYDALTLELNAEGIAATSVTSAGGGAPAPTAVPSAAERTASEIENLLNTQATAASAGDLAGFRQTLAPELQAAQAAITKRLALIPFTSYRLQLAPTANLGTGESISGVDVDLVYTLRGVNDDNPFHHSLRYDFARSAAGWQVTKIDPGENPPFWWLGDVVLRDTPHFLIFARPESQADFAALEQDAETAYATLQAKTLPLEPRYVAYFTATQNDFAALTGRTSRYLGVALSRYEFLGDTIKTTNRAFYINGASFRNNTGAIRPGERQTTITHELVHLALAAQTRPFTPPWLVEGVAVYLSEDTSSERQRLISDNRLGTLSLVQLTKAGALGEHDLTGDQASYEYAFAGATVAYLVERFGEAKVLDFYRSYAAVPASSVTNSLPKFGGSTRTSDAFSALSVSLTESAVPQFFGLSLQKLDSDVKAWLAQS